MNYLNIAQKSSPIDRITFLDSINNFEQKKSKYIFNRFLPAMTSQQTYELWTTLTLQHLQNFLTHARIILSFLKTAKWWFGCGTSDTLDTNSAEGCVDVSMVYKLHNHLKNFHIFFSFWCIIFWPHFRELDQNFRRVNRWISKNRVLGPFGTNWLSLNHATSRFSRQNTSKLVIFKFFDFRSPKWKWNGMEEFWEKLIVIFGNLSTKIRILKIEFQISWVRTRLPDDLSLQKNQIM